MHEILNGLNPDGDARLLEALGVAGATSDAAPARRRLRLAADVIVTPIIPAKRADCARQPMLQMSRPARRPEQHDRRE